MCSKRRFLFEPSGAAIFRSTVCALVLLTSSGVTSAFGQQPSRAYPPQFQDAEEFVYKRVGETDLKVWVFPPESPKSSAKSLTRPAIVFFFGGGWRSGSPKQFEQHCRYLAKRGMLAVLADYRVASRHEVKAVECVADAKDAIRWIRDNADMLQVDRQRVVAAGGSAGGHLAACCALIESDEDSGKTRCQPDATVLFNPALVLARVKERMVSS